MILSQNQAYQIGPHQLTVVENLLRVDHRGHAVYRMRQANGQMVVCKIATSPEAAKQMEHEQAVLTSLADVPGVVRSLGVYPFGEQLALLVEYVNAPHVARGRLHVTALSEHRAQTWPVVVALMTEGTRILEQAHMRSIIHADIKLQNFLYTADEKLYLADWDHSLVLPAQPDAHTPAEGTPQFMAPEQVRHERVDARTDIYSLGVSCLALLYGARVTPRYLVVGETVTERTTAEIVKALRVNETIKTDLIPPPQNDVEAALQTIWRSMIAANPAERPSAMTAVRAALPMPIDILPKPVV